MPRPGRAPALPHGGRQRSPLLTVAAERAESHKPAVRAHALCVRYPHHGPEAAYVFCGVAGDCYRAIVSMRCPVPAGSGSLTAVSADAYRDGLDARAVPGPAG